MKEPQFYCKPRTLKSYSGLVLRGFAMGVADIIPGVSGGTMALILGIYEELICSIRAIDIKFMKLLFKLKIQKAIENVPWKFLLSLLCGIGLAILSLSKLLGWLIDNHPAFVWSFFFGLVLSSVLTVSKRITHWNLISLSSTVVAVVGSYFLVGAMPVQTPEAPWFLFLSGFIAICAMILPGISGAFILVLLGKYQYVLNAVNQRDIWTILIVSAGATVGILTFSQILGWLFKRYHDFTIAVLTGLMIGSLRKLWPWKENISSITDSQGRIISIEQINIIPEIWTGEFLFALVLAIVGVTVVLVMNKKALLTKST